MSQWIRVVVAAVLAGSVASLAPAAAQAGHVSGRITIQEKNNAPSPDLGDAVVYLEGHGVSLPATRFEITISDKTFSPHVLVVPSGSTVAFPNHDPFDHNVFSVSDSNSFDLGLYGRGEGKTTVLKFPGLVRVFCNVHPRMVALVQVMATHHFAQAGADGSFTISGVEPGTYKLHVWHERAPQEMVRDVTVGPNGLSDIQVTLNARSFRWQPHKNKFGKDYPTNAGRERY
ncbi:MAG TPA: carboxypeptidase regulatory-like domain-containing protein [Gemmatimonadales bacterium]|nr:carboxypeptidase regulatory-like domain-containing protein [Gemmatimonadales bacterium]